MLLYCLYGLKPGITTNPRNCYHSFAIVWAEPWCIWPLRIGKSRSFSSHQHTKKTHGHTSIINRRAYNFLGVNCLFSPITGSSSISHRLCYTTATEQRVWYRNPACQRKRRLLSILVHNLVNRISFASSIVFSSDYLWFSCGAWLDPSVILKGQKDPLIINVGNRGVLNAQSGRKTQK